MTSDAERWAQAQELLDGIPSDAAQRRLRRAQRLNLLGLAVVLAVVLGSMFALDVWSGSDAQSDSDDTPLWRSITGLVVLLAGAVVAFRAALRQIRRNPWRDAWRTPLLVLRLSQRRHLTREVVGRAPADPAHVPLARHLATMFVRQSLEPRLALGLLLVVVGQLVMSASWGWATVVVLLAAGWPVLTRRNRRAQAYLDAHPAQRTA